MSETLNLSALLAEAEAKVAAKKKDKTQSRKWASGSSDTIPNPLNVHQFAWRPTAQVIILQVVKCTCGYQAVFPRGLLIREEHPRTRAIRMHQRPTPNWRQLPKMTQYLPECKLHACPYCFAADTHSLPCEAEPLNPETLFGTDETQRRVDKILDGLSISTPRDDLSDKGQPADRKYDEEDN